MHVYRFLFTAPTSTLSHGSDVAAGLRLAQASYAAAAGPGSLALLGDDFTAAAKLRSMLLLGDDATAGPGSLVLLGDHNAPSDGPG